MSDSQGRITAFWSAIAAEYEAHPGNVAAFGSAEYDAWVDAVRETMPAKPSDALDVATGTGFVALILAGLGHRVTGIDLSPEMMTVAASTAADRGLQVRFAEGDAVAPPFPAQSFDVVTSRHLLWTLREPDRAIADWRRLLRPGGRVVAFDGRWFPAEAAAADEGTSQEPGIFERHYTAETRAALPLMHLTDIEPAVRLVEQAGFERVEARDLPALVNRDAGDVVPYVIIGHA